MNGEEFCRFCFESNSESSRGHLVSPCACRGSAKFVHIECLRQWQVSVMNGRPFGENQLERIKTCQICETNFIVDGRLFCGLSVRPGALLFSTPKVMDNDFQHSIVLMCGEHYGIDLTRAFDDELDPVYTVLKARHGCDISIQMRRGGPIGSPPVYTILATFHMPDFSTLVTCAEPRTHLYVSGHLGQAKALDLLEQLFQKESSVSEDSKNIWIIFRGIVTWDAWQLVQEIARETWSLRFKWRLDTLSLAPADLCTHFQRIDLLPAERPRRCMRSCVCQ